MCYGNVLKQEQTPEAEKTLLEHQRQVSNLYPELGTLCFFEQAYISFLLVEHHQNIANEFEPMSNAYNQQKQLTDAACCQCLAFLYAARIINEDYSASMSETLPSLGAVTQALFQCEFSDLITRLESMTTHHHAFCLQQARELIATKNQTSGQQLHQ